MIRIGSCIIIGLMATYALAGSTGIIAIYMALEQSVIAWPCVSGKKL